MTDTLARRSKNGNVFHYSAYWRTWSRILFHKNDRLLSAKLNLPPGLCWVELDLTAINSSHIHGWKNYAQHGNIRCHSTSLERDDIITGTLPGSVVELMRRFLTDDAIDKLIDTDYLPYIDFEKGHKASNGGFKFNDATRDCVSPQQYLAAIRRDGGGPGILMHDVQDAYDALSADWSAKIDKLIIRNGLKEQS